MHQHVRITQDPVRTVGPHRGMAEHQGVGRRHIRSSVGTERIPHGSWWSCEQAVQPFTASGLPSIGGRDAFVHLPHGAPGRPFAIGKLALPVPDGAFAMHHPVEPHRPVQPEVRPIEGEREHRAAQLKVSLGVRAVPGLRDGGLQLGRIARHVQLEDRGPQVQVVDPGEVGLRQMLQDEGLSVHPVLEQGVLRVQEMARGHQQVGPGTGLQGAHRAFQSHELRGHGGERRQGGGGVQAATHHATQCGPQGFRFLQSVGREGDGASGLHQDARPVRRQLPVLEVGERDLEGIEGVLDVIGLREVEWQDQRHPHGRRRIRPGIFGSAGMHGEPHPELRRQVLDPVKVLPIMCLEEQGCR